MTRLILLLALAAAIAPTDAAAVRIAAVGDIASCAWGDDKATGDLVRAIHPSVVLTLGDNAYPDGRLSEFKNCYDPPWGSFKRKTRPAPGNHDYKRPRRTGTFATSAHEQGLAAAVITSTTSTRGGCTHSIPSAGSLPRLGGSGEIYARTRTTARSPTGTSPASPMHPFTAIRLRSTRSGIPSPRTAAT